MSIDPEARAYLDLVAQAAAPPVYELAAAQARANYAAAAGRFVGDVEDVAGVEERMLGGVPVRVYRPALEAGLPVTAYFHGGGWVLGGLDSHDALCRRLAAWSGSIVVSVDYRLAPEHPYPAAVDDAWAVTDWLAGGAAEIGGDGARLAVAGDSAGGNLAAVAALRARDAGVLLRLQALLYPVTDSDLDRPSHIANAEGYGLAREAMRWYWDQYCPDAARRVEAFASPLRADVRGVTAAYVLACELDPLCDEGVAYARRLEEAGVPVALRLEEEMIHGFMRVPGAISRGYDAARDVASALRAALAEGAGVASATSPG